APAHRRHRVRWRRGPAMPGSPRRGPRGPGAACGGARYTPVTPHQRHRGGAVYDLPRGTVTLLFTDIAGSTKLLRRLGERYAEVLAVHHRLLRLAFGAWDGHEIDNQGDSFFV